MATELAETRFAPAERQSAEELASTADALRRNTLIRELIEGYPEICLVLNDQRQILLCNEYVCKLLGGVDPSVATGGRPGEIFGCFRAREGPGGCGTSEACQTCGAVNAIIECGRTGRRVRSECRICLEGAEGPRALDLEVVTTALHLEGQEFTIFAARDISAAKRRAVLERLFFHDIVNTAGGILGLSELYSNEHSSCSPNDVKRLSGLMRQLVEQIQAHRDLTYAEQGQLSTNCTRVSVRELFEDLKDTFASHPVAADRSLTFSIGGEGEIVFQSDETLLRRILTNLIKNAFEAIPAGELVTVLCRHSGGPEIEFVVHNPGVMPRRVQMQVFQRSFSTKSAKGRGLGTYSVKLFTTSCLGGKVSFESNEQIGTAFHVRLPFIPNPTQTH